MVIPALSDATSFAVTLASVMSYDIEWPWIVLVLSKQIES